MAVEITLKGRRIPLIYTTYEMKQMQEEIAPLSELNRAIYGRNPKDETDTSGYASAEHLSNVAKLIRILGNAGLEESGEEGNLTDKWVLRAIKPGELVEMVNACTDAMNEGMESEIPDDIEKKAKEGPVDVTLEEIKKKKDKAG
ncbi:MAG: hypothetical protein IKS46_03505 [Clostridia bacterium]|nr:hypothetical protein [Clostridia bacterium]